jgi:peptide/nickel transport system substrate-binding protein
MIPASNWTFYNNPAFDDLLKQERQEVDPEKRLELLNKAIEMAVDDAPWIPTWTRENLQAAHNKVKGYELNPSTSYIDLYPVWIEP